jgi:hypothetical protein
MDGVLVEQLMEQNGLDKKYRARIARCTNMAEVFRALSDKAAMHVALLTEDGQPIENMFEYIKERLHKKHSVALALFIEKDRVPAQS